MIVRDHIFVPCSGFLQEYMDTNELPDQLRHSYFLSDIYLYTKPSPLNSLLAYLFMTQSSIS